MLKAVIARLDRTIQFCTASMMDREAPGHWATRCTVRRSAPPDGDGLLWRDYTLLTSS
jgi:hypothetical protein